MAWLHYRRKPLYSYVSQRQLYALQPRCPPPLCPPAPQASPVNSSTFALSQLQLAPLSAADAGGGPADAGGPIAEKDAHGLDADLALEPRGIDIAVGPDKRFAQGSEGGIGTEQALIWPTKQEMGIVKKMDPKYKQFTNKLSGYRHLINRNNQNELIINGEPIVVRTLLILFALSNAGFHNSTLRVNLISSTFFAIFASLQMKSPLESQKHF